MEHLGGAYSPTKICRAPYVPLPPMKFVVSKIIMDFSKPKRLHYTELFTRSNYPALNIFRRSIDTCDFTGCDCHPGVCNKPDLDNLCITISAFNSFQFPVDTLVSFIHTPSCQSRGTKIQVYTSLYSVNE